MWKGVWKSVEGRGRALGYLRERVQRRRAAAAAAAPRPSQRVAAGPAAARGVLGGPLGACRRLAQRAADEREADRYSVDTNGDAEALVAGLKKLSKNNLDNLTPHPFHVWLTYSHPPVLERIQLIRRRAQELKTTAQTNKSMH